MYIKLPRETRRAWTLVEMIMAAGIFSLTGLAVTGLYLFSIRSMASMYDYCLLDQYNRQAMDQLTREIRSAVKVLNYNTNTIRILAANGDGSTAQVTYSFDASSKKMLRTSSDGSSKVLLNDCNLLSFQLFTRCPSNGVFGSFPVATDNWSNTVKVLQLTWKTSRSQPNGLVSSENIQTARIVIRNQQDS